jgi:hypothetical protein
VVVINLDDFSNTLTLAFLCPCFNTIKPVLYRLAELVQLQA